MSYTDEGNLLLVTRAYSAGALGQLLIESVPTTAREYVLDEADETLVNVWSRDYDDDVIQALEGGDVHRLSNGNTLISFGTASKVREVTPDGTTAWALDWGGSRRLGRTFFVRDLYLLLP